MSTGTSTGFKLAKATAGGGASFPVGLYVVKLKDIVPEVIENPKFGDGNRLRWIFSLEQVIDADDDSAEESIGQELWAWTSHSMARRATARAFAGALLGRAIEDDEEIDTDDLIGKRAKASIIPRKDDPERTALGTLTPHKGKGARSNKDEDLFD